MSEWIIGRNPVYELLRARRRQVSRLRFAQGVKLKGRLNEILELADAQEISVEQVPRGRLDVLGKGHQGVAAETSRFPYVVLEDILDAAERRGEDIFILVLDTLQDPQNLGTLLRTAEIVGVHGVLLPHRRAATVTPAVVSASSGASEHMLVAQLNLAQGLARLKEKGLWVVGLEGSSAAQPATQVPLDGPLALVVGGEGQGMRELVKASCDFLMRLPMRGKIESLNAAVAGSVALYLAWAARGYNGETSL